MGRNATAGGVLGDGIIGAGPVTQAIHLPSLARLADVFAVPHRFHAEHLHPGAHGYTAAARLPNGAPATLQGVISSARPAGLAGFARLARQLTHLA